MLSFKRQVDAAITNVATMNSYNHHLRLLGSGDDVYFDINDLNSINSDNIDVITTVLAVGGTLEDKSKITVIGIKYSEISNLGITVIKDDNAFKDNNKYSILLSQTMATQLNLEIGGGLKVSDSEENEYNFIVSGICADSMWFLQNPTSIIVKLETAQSFPNMESKLITAFIRLKNINLIDDEYLKMGDVLKTKNITIEKMYDTTTYDFYIAPIDVVLKLFSGLALALSLFLLYYTYKRIIDNRIPAYGTLISLGITKSKIWALLFLEILIFVIIISLIGSALSVFVISALIKNVIGIGLFSFNVLNMAMIFLSFLVVTYFVSIIIVTRIFRAGAVKIIKKQVENNKTTNKKLVFFSIAGLGLISFVCGIIFRYISINLMSVIGLILLLVGTIILSFYLIYIVSFIGKMVSVRRFPKLVGLFTKTITNIFKAKGYICIVLLLTILIALTSTAELTIAKSMRNYFINTDLVVVSKSDIYVREDFSAFKDVKNVYKTRSVKLLVDQQNITIIGIDTSEFESYTQETFDNIEQTMSRLDAHDKGVVLSKTLLKSKALAIDSDILIPTVQGDLSFKIVGSFETMDNLGLNVYVTNDIFNKYFITESTQYYIDADESSVNNLIKEISDSEKFGKNITIAKTTDIMSTALLNITTIIQTIKLFISVLCVISIICCAINAYLNVISNLRSSVIEATLGKTRLQIVLETLAEHVFLIGLITILFASIIAAFANYYIMDILEYTVGSFKYSFTMSGATIIYMLVIVVGTLIFPVITYLKKSTLKSTKEEF
jgi:hypothetical protein